MQTVAAQDAKRRGLVALDGLLERGPVQVMRNNRPACVVLSTADDARLTVHAGALGVQDAPPDIWSLLLAAAAPATATRTRDELDAGLASDRDRWDRP